VRIPVAASLRFPPEGNSAEGESAPKARLKSVVDGKQVNIPALLYVCPRRTHEANQVDPLAGPRAVPAWPFERMAARLDGAKGLEPYRLVMLWCRENLVGR
jgi:hypothetical protein